MLNQTDLNNEELEATQQEQPTPETEETSETPVSEETQTEEKPKEEDSATDEELEETFSKEPPAAKIKGERSLMATVKKAIELEEVHYATVEKVQEGTNGKQVMTVSLNTPALRGVKIFIPRRDADLDFKSGDLFHLLGNVVPVVITGRSATKHLIGSRKKAQQILKDYHMDDIMNGAEMNGTLLSFGRSGAFFQAERKFGSVVGFMRDSDFSTDYLSLKEAKKTGDTMRMRCSSVSKEGKISWEAVKKAKRTERITCLAEKGSSCEGEVKSIVTFAHGDHVFVTIQPGVDASCLYPQDLTVEVGDKVFVKIQEVDHPEDKLVPRGRAIIVKVK